MIPIKIRIQHWRMFHGADMLKTVAGTVFFFGVFAIAGTLDRQDAEILELEMSARAHSAALAALLNGDAITANNGTWAAQCEVITESEK